MSKADFKVHYDESNVMDFFALLIGPEDTPYEYGMFEFHLTFPNGFYPGQDWVNCRLPLQITAV